MSIQCPECKLLNPYHMKVCLGCKRRFTEEEIKESRIINRYFLKRVKQYCFSKHRFINLVPWFRNAARGIDFTFVSIISYVLILPLKRPLEAWKKGIDNLQFSFESLGFMVVLFVVGLLSFLVVWFVLEPLFLSRWGWTPGKRIMGIRVRDKNNEVLDYKTAFRRTLKLWGWGLGFKIPLITMLCQLHAYQEWQKGREMKWDRDLQLKVVVENGGIFRMLLITASVVASGVLMFFE